MKIADIHDGTHLQDELRDIEAAALSLEKVSALASYKMLDDALALNMNPEDVEKQLVKLVLVLVELIRRLMESQAINRMERGTLTDDQIDQLGETLFRAKQTVDDLREKFGIADEDFNLDLGPLGRLL